MSYQLNPLQCLMEFDNHLYSYFKNNVYPKLKGTIVSYAKNVFAKYAKQNLLLKHGVKINKILDIDGCYNLDISYVDPERKIYKAQAEGRIEYSYTSKDYGTDEDGMWFNSIIFFRMDGWYKLVRIYLGS